MTYSVELQQQTNPLGEMALSIFGFF